jgi:4a-hydroxytetrahydrobiopterin dehydratase
MTLSKQTCIPCQGGTPMTEAEAHALLGELNGWSLTDSAAWLEKHYTFPNFVEALAWVNRVGALAEEQQHHPDMLLGWGYVTVRLQTHAMKGLHQSDFILAAKMDAL